MTTTKRFFLETYGCQMNVNDSEKVAGLLLAEGYERVDSSQQADTIFINTCAVREKASEKLFHAVGRLRRRKREQPELTVAVGGCVPQLLGRRILERAPEVDVLVGPHNVSRVPEFLTRARSGERGLVDLDRKADRFSVPDGLIAHSNPVRAYVTVMEGCNHVCSFCVVPRTRGPEVCRPPAAILAEVEALVARGVPEVMLLGQTVNAYRHGDTSFGGLLRLIHEVAGLKRLRFTTSHPAHVDEELVEVMATLPKVCPYLHLPVQSGSETTLLSMRRGYTVEEYRETTAQLRERIPGLALSSDIICGYPGETTADFEATIALIEEQAYDGLFVFAYSPRPGTTALRLRDDVAEDEKRRRVQVVNEFQQRAQAQRNAAKVGTVEPVLVESVDGNRLTGRTPQFKLVHFDGPAGWAGSVVQVRIEIAGANALIGSVVASDSLTEGSAVPIF